MVKIVMQRNKLNKNIYSKTIITFTSLLLFCLFVGIAIVRNIVHIEKMQREQLILESSVILNEVISKQLYQAKEELQGLE